MSDAETTESKESKKEPKLPARYLAIRARAQIRNGGSALVEAIVSSDCIAITWLHNHVVDEAQSGDETARTFRSTEPGTVWAEARYEFGDWRMSNKIRIEES